MCCLLVYKGILCTIRIAQFCELHGLLPSRTVKGKMKDSFIFQCCLGNYLILIFWKFCLIYQHFVSKLHNIIQSCWYRKEYGERKPLCEPVLCVVASLHSVSSCNCAFPSGELQSWGIPVPDYGSPPSGALLTSVLILFSHQKR